MNYIFGTGAVIFLMLSILFKKNIGLASTGLACVYLSVNN
jgi:hypothetical protein